MRKHVTLFGVISFIAFGLSLFSVPVLASPLQDEFAAVAVGGNLPSCPSLFHCAVRKKDFLLLI